MSSLCLPQIPDFLGNLGKLTASHCPDAHEYPFPRDEGCRLNQEVPKLQQCRRSSAKQRGGPLKGAVLKFIPDNEDGASTPDRSRWW